MRTGIPNIVIVEKLGRCLFSVPAGKRDGIPTCMHSCPHQPTGGKHIPLVNVKILVMLDVDRGGDGEPNVLAATGHVRLGHGDDAAIECLKHKGVGVKYAGKVPEACDALPSEQRHASPAQ